MSPFICMWLIAAGTALVGNAPVFAGFFLSAAGCAGLAEWADAKRRAALSLTTEAPND